MLKDYLKKAEKEEGLCDTTIIKKAKDIIKKKKKKKILNLKFLIN